MTRKKGKDLFFIALIYAAAFVGGWFGSAFAQGELLRFFLFDLFATLITFFFSVLLKNSSVYDAYWSLTPLFMAILLFLRAGAFRPFHLLFLAAFALWSVRLTANWCAVFTDFSYEDWRYAKFRAENPPVLWFFINLFGIHLVPTLVVFGGMLPLFALAKADADARVLPGVILLLCGVALEFFADRQMHAHLAADQTHSVCRRGLWRYSRHPNYLGEITVWVGVFLAMLPIVPEKWYYGVGALSVALLFCFVSVPLMEKRQLARRPQYAQYKKDTSCLLLLPPKGKR